MLSMTSLPIRVDRCAHICTQLRELLVFRLPGTTFRRGPFVWGVAGIGWVKSLGTDRIIKLVYAVYPVNRAKYVNRADAEV